MSVLEISQSTPCNSTGHKQKKWDWLPLESGPGQAADGALLDLLSWQARLRPPPAIRFPDGTGPNRCLHRTGALLPYLHEPLSFRLPPSQCRAHRAPQRRRSSANSHAEALRACDYQIVRLGPQLLSVQPGFLCCTWFGLLLHSRAGRQESRGGPEKAPTAWRLLAVWTVRLSPPGTASRWRQRTANHRASSCRAIQSIAPRIDLRVDYRLPQECQLAGAPLCRSKRRVVPRSGLRPGRGLHKSLSLQAVCGASATHVAS